MDKPKKALKTLDRIEAFLKKEIDGADRIVGRFEGAEWASSPAIIEAVDRIQSRLAFAKNDLAFVHGEMKILKQSSKAQASAKKKKEKPTEPVAESV